MGGSIAIAALVAAWLHARPYPTHPVDAQAWLEGGTWRTRIEQALRPVLLKLWLDAWKAGAKGGGEAGGKFEAIPDVIVQDRIGRFAAKWLYEVTETRMRRIAVILAKGGTAKELEDQIRAVLDDEADARLIAITEVTRAMAAAAIEAYRAAGVEKVRWITRSHNPCPVCLANEAAGARFLGEAFPSGLSSPPEHPNCECALIPAEGELCPGLGVLSAPARAVAAVTNSERSG